MLAFALAALAVATPAYASKASTVFRKAEKQEKAGRIVQAYLLYAEAAALDPQNKTYRAKTLALQAKAALIQAQNAPKPTADTGPDSDAGSEDPLLDDPEFTTITSRDLERARQALPPAQLKLPTGRFDFHANGDAKVPFNQIAERCGLQTQFDSEFDKTPLKVRFDIDDVDCREALHAAEAATSAFVVPLSSKLIFISTDTAAKRTDNEQTMSVVIPVPTALTTQELTEIAQAVKQTTGIEKLAWDSASNEIVIRDRVSRVIPARALIEQLTAYRGAVMIEVRFLQLSDSDILSFGVNLTNSFSIIWSGSQSLATAGATLSNLIRTLRQGAGAFGISALQASIVANLTQSTSRTLLDMRVRAVSGLPSTIHVGEKYPVLTSGYFGAATTSTSSTQGTAYTPPPSFTYQDLGVSLKVLPVVCSTDLITMDIESQYQLLQGTSIDGIPILANRAMSTRISVHSDEWAVIGGLMEDTDTKSISGVAGLARLPIFGWLFRTQNHEKDRGHIVIVIKPHIVGEPPATRVSPAMRVGPDARPLSPI